MMFKRINNKKIKEKETFLQSVYVMMVSQVIIKALGVFYKLYLTNRKGFGDEGNAIANSGFQVFSLFLVFFTIGIPTAISKLIAERMSTKDIYGTYRIVKISLIIVFIIGLSSSLLLYIFAGQLANNYLHIKETELSIIALCPSLFFISISSVLRGFFLGKGQIGKTANAQSLDQIIKTLSTIIIIETTVFITRKNNIELLSAISCLAITLGNFVEFLSLGKEYIIDLINTKREIIKSKKINIKINKNINYNNYQVKEKQIIKNIFYIAIPVSLTALISTISKNIDSITIVNDLKNVIGYEEAKIQYGILSGKVDTLINLPLSFNMSIVTALLPEIASNKGKIKLQENRINQSILIGMIISIPIMLILFSYSRQVLNLLFPNASSGELILKISSISILFISLEQIINIVLNGVGKNTIPVISTIIGVVAKAIINRALVPRTDLIIGGIVGATIATLACHALSSIISTVMLINLTEFKLNIKNIIKPFCIGLIMIVISKNIYYLLLLQKMLDYRISFIISLCVGLFVFIILICKFTTFKVINIKKKK